MGTAGVLGGIIFRVTADDGLTSQLDDRGIDILPEVFTGQIQIHRFGIGPVL